MALGALVRLTVVDILRQPVTWLVCGVSVVLIGLSYLFGMFAFITEDRLRMLATAGIAVAVINALFLAVVAASTAVHEELANRTALTLFAKPLSRAAFLFGKALGVWLAVLAATAPVILAHAGALALGGSTGFEHTWLEGGGGHHHHADESVPVPWAAVTAGHALGLAHAAVMTSMAVVLALRLSLAANILACFALFVAGHLLGGAGIGGAVAIPALALFNVDDVIQVPGQRLSATYLTATIAYASCFCAGCLLTGLALFERQDIQ